MSRFTKSLFLLVLISLVLAACGAQETAAPTEDINAVYTQAAETAYAQLTQIAQAPTTAPTEQPTLEPTVAATATTEATQSITVETPLATITVIVNDTPPASPTFDLLPTATLGFDLTPQATVTPLPPISGGGSGDNCLNAAYVADISVPDYTEFKLDEAFTKIWRMKNTGTCKWDEGFGLVFVGGVKQGGIQEHYINQKEEFVSPGGEENFNFDMIAKYTDQCKKNADNPKGACIGHYRMISDKKVYFGFSVTLVIIVKK